MAKLAKLAKLKYLHLVGNPIEAQDRNDYRRKVIRAVPQITQLDNFPLSDVP